MAGRDVNPAPFPSQIPPRGSPRVGKGRRFCWNLEASPTDPLPCIVWMLLLAGGSRSEGCHGFGTSSGPGPGCGSRNNNNNLWLRESSNSHLPERWDSRKTSGKPLCPLGCRPESWKREAEGNQGNRLRGRGFLEVQNFKPSLRIWMRPSPGISSWGFSRGFIPAGKPQALGWCGMKGSHPAGNHRETASASGVGPWKTRNVPGHL